ncbi:MAG: putative AdoMet-dependent methyltransferase, family [Francisellaceae bacterium]|nr:putative AdoMet-dependent methyltransferase, family [Francisellaceae bacterium]
MYKIIELHPKFSKRFIQGHPWVYSNELIINSAEPIIPGEIVELNYQGKYLATGFLNTHSLISFRALSREKHRLIDIHFLKDAFLKAEALRTHFYNQPFYRLIHAEGDFLPGLIIDRYQDIFVIQLNTAGMELLKPIIILALKNAFKVTTLIFKNDSPIRKQEGLAIFPIEIQGEAIKYLDIIENHAQFSVDIVDTQKTGWFYDHRNNRELIANLASNTTLIDYFCYSGGFSIQAACKGARKVIGVDSSKTAIENAKRSAIQNNLTNTEFMVSDVFKDLDRRLALQEQFDIVVLDPPAFVKVKKDLAQGLKGYEKLLTKGISLVKGGGLLMIASCSYHIKLTDLKYCLNKALYKTRRTAQILQSLSSGFDHPIHPALEESEYLKGLLIQIQ